MHVKNALRLELLFSCSRVRSFVTIDSSFDPLHTNATNDVLCKRLSFRRNKYVSTSYGNSRDTASNQISVTARTDKVNQKSVLSRTIRTLDFHVFQQSFLSCKEKKKKKKKKLSRLSRTLFHRTLSLSLCFRWRSDKTTGEFGDLATS